MSGRHLSVVKDGGGAEERRLLAIGLVAGDISAPAIARFAQVHHAVADRALTACRDAGLLSPDGTVDDMTRASLIAELPSDLVAEVHAAAARHLIAGGPAHIKAAVDHARAAGTLLPLEELVAMADRAGRISLSLHDYESAHSLLQIADQLDTSGDLRGVAGRLVELADAADGAGRFAENRELLARAVTVAETADDADIAAQAAVAYAFSIEAVPGDIRATALIARAESLDPSPDWRVMLRAARAVAEMRIPAQPGSEVQLAYVPRPTVARPIAQEALDASERDRPLARATALCAWRATHRSPDLLRRRREISSESLDLTQQLRQPRLQVEAAAWLAIDAIESGDRPLYDEGLSVARWVAERNGNPRLRWRALTLAVGAAHLDGDVDLAERHRLEARDLGVAFGWPGWFAADSALRVQAVTARDVPDDLPHDVFDVRPARRPASPQVRTLEARIAARRGDTATARQSVRWSLRRLDHEASGLLLATQCTAVTVLLEDVDLARELLPVLEPWADHVSVDNNGWWIDGPVSLALAELHIVLGDAPQAHRYLRAAQPVARAINDVRALRRIDTVIDRIGPPPPVDPDETPSSTASPTSSAARPTGADAGLTAREMQVLRFLAGGATNREIAASLAYSASTIRVDTMSIYRKLGVKGRVDAVAQAIASGLLNELG